MSHDAVVVGSGPNGLAAAVTLAKAGRSVLVREAADVLGGGVHSAELTLPGFAHDVCSSIYPLLRGSAFFREASLEGQGLELLESPAAVAHPFDDGSAAVVERSIDETAVGLGDDAEAYRRLLAPICGAWDELEGPLLGPLLSVPRHPVPLARFSLHALRSAKALAEGTFATERARALFAGCAAHSMAPLERRPTASFGLVLLAFAHLFGWPFPKGGAQRITDTLVSLLGRLGGEFQTGAAVDSVSGLGARAVICDVVPRELARIAGDRLPTRYVRRLQRFPYGPGAFKVDFALDGPVPGKAADCARACTVHLGGTLAEIAESERAPAAGRHAERPFVLLAQHSLFDPSRAPQGKHTVWAYCHVPNGSDVDMTERIEGQIERFAPGFRDLVIGRSVHMPGDLERHNRNLVGGDLNAGAVSLRHLIARPVLSLVPYKTPARGLYLCSASTPPGGGVHGMCGYLAARAALSDAL
jgi:phytoene dehydrogenase-like protein